jgi:predicted DNA-binding transcriptional regulator AlpA
MDKFRTPAPDTTTRTVPLTIAAEKSRNTITTTVDRIVRPAEAVLITGRSLASIWRDCKDGRLTKIKTGANSVGFRLSHLLAFLDACPVVTSENAIPVAIGAKRGRPRKQTQAEV